MACSACARLRSALIAAARTSVRSVITERAAESSVTGGGGLTCVWAMQAPSVNLKVGKEWDDMAVLSGMLQGWWMFCPESRRGCDNVQRGDAHPGPTFEPGCLVMKVQQVFALPLRNGPPVWPCRLLLQWRC